jgi:hypothetical protein
MPPTTWTLLNQSWKESAGTLRFATRLADIAKN